MTSKIFFQNLQNKIPKSLFLSERHHKPVYFKALVQLACFFTMIPKMGLILYYMKTQNAVNFLKTTAAAKLTAQEPLSLINGIKNF